LNRVEKTAIRKIRHRVVVVFVHSLVRDAAGLAERVGRMDTQKASPEKKKDVNGGLKAALTLLAASALLYRAPTFFIYPTVTFGIALVCAAFGVMGLGFELSSRDPTKVISWDTLGIGLAIGGICFVVYRLSAWPALNVILSPFFVLALFSIISGTFDTIYRLVFGNLVKEAGRLSAVKLFVFLVQVIALIAGLLQSLQILKVIR